MDPLATFPLQRQDLAARVIGGEAVVVTPADSLVHELNEVATFVWERCDGRTSGQALVDALVAAFTVERSVAAADVRAVLNTLRDKHIVTLEAGPVAG